MNEATLSSWVPDILTQDLLFGVAGWQLLGVLLLVFVSLLAQRVGLMLISSWLRKLVGRVLPALETAVERSARPLSGMVIALVFGVGFPLLSFPGRIETVVAVAVRLLAVASGVWFFYRQIDVITDVLQEKADRTDTKLDDQVVPLVRRTLKAFIIVIGGIFILQNLKVDVASLVAGLGLGGLAFALAAKDTIANFFGALTIFVDRPFQIGDWVIIGGEEGTVEDVGFRTTRLRTFYNSVITVPNAKLTGTAIDNMGARQHRRIKCNFGLSLNTPPEKVQAFVEGTRAIIQAHPDTRKEYYHVYLNGIGDSTLNVLFYCFVTVPTWAEELKDKHELFLSVLRLAQDLKVEFAFPTQTLHVESFPGQAPAPASPPPDEAQLRGLVADFGPDGARSRPRFEAYSHGHFSGQDKDKLGS